MKRKDGKHWNQETPKGNGKRISRAVLNSFLAVVLVVGLAPSMSFAEGTDDTLDTNPSDVMTTPADTGSGDGSTTGGDSGTDGDNTSGDNTSGDKADDATAGNDTGTDADGDGTDTTGGEGGGSDKDATTPTGSGDGGKTDGSDKAKEETPKTTPAKTPTVTLHKDSATGEALTSSNATYYYNGDVCVEMSVASAATASYSVDGGEAVAIAISDAEAGTGSALTTLKAADGASASHSLVVTATGTDGKAKTSAVTVVLDKEDPTVAVKYLDQSDAELTGTKDGGITYVNLPENTNTIKLEARATDSIALDSKSELKVEWLKADGGAASKAGETKSFDSEKKATTTAFNASDFVEDGALLNAKVTLTVVDAAGNETKSETVYQFCSESGMLNLLAPDFTLTPAEGVAQADDVFNGDVVVAVGADAAKWDQCKSLIKEGAVTVDGVAQAGDGGTAVTANDFAWTASNGDEKANKTYELAATYTTTHGATKKLSKNFTIDTTVPELAVSLNTDAASNAIEGEGGAVYYFGKDAAPVISLSATDASRLQSASENIKVTLNGEDVSAKVEWGADYTATLDNSLLSQATEYVVEVDFQGKDKFGIELPSDAKSTESFVWDANDPVITVAFKSKPAADVADEEDASIITAILQKMEDAVVAITFTVDDPTFDSAAVTMGGKELEGVEWTPAESGTSYSYEMLYSDLAEQNEMPLKVTATDKAKNASEYEYVSYDETAYSKVTVDKTSPVLESFELYEDEAFATKATAKTVDGVDYYSYAQVYGKLSVKDANFDAAGSTVVVKKGGETVATLSGEAWQQYANGYFVTYAFQPGVDYSLEVTANDLAKNDTLKETTKTFTVDNEAPSIEVTMQQPKTNVEGSSSDWYVTANADGDVVASIVVADDTLAAVEVTADGDTQSYSAEDASKGLPVPFAESAAGTTHSLTVKAIDKLGHATTYNYGDAAVTEATADAGKKSAKDSAGAAIEGNATFIVDLQKPDIAVNIDQAVHHSANKGEQVVDYYNTVASDTKALTATITVTDANIDPAAMVTVTPTGGVWSGKWEPGQNAGEYVTTVAYAQQTGPDETFGLQVSAKDAYAANDASRAVEYTYGANAAGDKGGALSTTAGGLPIENGGTAFVLDTEKPDVKVEMSVVRVGAPVDGIDYYTAPVTATITVTDNNFTDNEELSYVKVTSPENVGEGVKVSGWDGGSGTYTRTIEFPDNEAYEQYQFVVQATDLVGFQTAYTYGDNKAVEEGGGNLATTAGDEFGAFGTAFVVDSVGAKVDVTLDATYAGTLDGVDYYDDAAVTATVQVTELNFDAKDGNPADMIKVTTSDGKAPAGAYEIAGTWTAKDAATGVYTATIEFQQNAADEAYQFTVGPINDAISAKYPDVREPLQYAYGDVDDNVTTTVKGTAVNGPSLVVDNQAPQVSVEFLDASGKAVAPVGTDVDKSIDYWDMATLRIKATVSEAHFDSTNAQGHSPVTATGQVGTSADDQKWVEESPGTWTMTIDFLENTTFQDGKLVASDLSIDMVDLLYAAQYTTKETTNDAHKTTTAYADNTPEAFSGKTFVLDSIAPTVSVKIDQKLQNTYNNIDYYGTATNGVLTATITVTDNNFDDDVELYPVEPTNGTWSGAWETQDNREYTTTVTFEENAGTTSDIVIGTIADKVYTVASDKDAVKDAHTNSYDYGTKDTTDSTGTAARGDCFVLDMTPPDLKSASETMGWVTRWQEDSAKPYLFYTANGSGITMRMKDDNGIASAVTGAPFKLSLGGEVREDASEALLDAGTESFMTVALVQAGSYDDRNAYNNTMRTALVKITDYAGNYTIWNITADGKEFRASDPFEANAGNAAIAIKSSDSVHPTVMVLDQVGPALSWGAAPTAGAYYNTPQSAVIKISELNFDYLFDNLKQFFGNRQVALVTKQACEAGRATSTTPVSVNQFRGGGSSWSYTIPFNEEGHYTVSASFNDIADNPSNTINLDEFTLDWTAPVIQDIVFDNNDVRNGKYYKAGRTATITIIEHNWDQGLAVITTNGTWSGKWEGDGDTHTCTVSFTTDGTYYLSVSCTDKAGNDGGSKSAEEFVVDLTAPTIDFSNVEGQHAYNDVIAPVINYHDEANFDANGMSYTLTGNKTGAKSLDASQSVSGNDGTVAYADFDRIVENDDIYTLQAHLTDLAGNEAENSITFSVNRFGSNFIVVNAEDFEGHNGYLADPVEVLVQEINVCGAESEKHGVAVTHGLATENLKMTAAGSGSKEGFYIQSGADGAGWATYLYHIGEGNFTQDGNYHVVITSTDVATNLNNSKSYYNPDKHDVADAEVSFILDTADPIIDGLTVTSGGLYDAAKDTVSFTVTDNIGIETVQVEVDGATQQITPDMGGLCAVEVAPQSWTPRNMTIEATDLAGRTAKADINDFNLTTDFVELHLPLVIGGGVVVIAAVAGWFIFGARRRKQEEEEK